MPLRVAVGAVAGVTGGPATYAVELVHALAGLREPDLDLSVLTDRPDLFADLPARSETSRGVAVIELPLRSAWAQPWWDSVAVPRALRALARSRAGGVPAPIDVYHGTKNALPLRGLAGATATVATIHDLAVRSEPETFSRAQRIQLEVHLRHAARLADRIICVSDHAARDVEARLGVAAERIAVVRHGISPRFQPLADGARRMAVRASLGVEQGHLVSFVGTAQPRKRVDVAIDAVARLSAEGMPITLAIAGRRRPGYEPAWLAAPPPFVRLLGEIDAAALVELYGASDVMVSPSSFEGFGLTFVEAMACACPVIGIDATSVPEVVGDGGILVARPDAALIADALRRLLGDPELRARTAARALARARSLSWPRAAAETLEVYRAAARTHRRGESVAGSKDASAAQPDPRSEASDAAGGKHAG